jgi:cell division protein FtsB
MLNEKVLQEELAVLQADFDKTKKSVETMEKEIANGKNNLNAIYGALQQTEKLLKLSRGDTDGKKV